MAEFPAGLFRVEGDAGSIRASAGRWSGFGSAAVEAAGQITGLDTGGFVGPEGDEFRAGLNRDMPRHLRITGDAYAKVAGGLTTFAGVLESVQERMGPVAARAPGLWEAVRAARGRVERAAEADAAHEREVADRPAGAAGPDSYRSDGAAAGVALARAQREWDACVAQANGLRGEHAAAVRDCVRVINEAKGMRFTENPKWWDLKGQFTNFVRDNKELLKKLSGALKIVSLVAGLLSFIPVLAPVMVPLAIGTALAASAIDLSVYYATGEGSLKTILIDVGLNLLPGVGKLARLGMGAMRGGQVAYGTGKLGKAVLAARRNLPDPQSMRNGAIFEYVSNGKRVLSDVRWSRLGTHSERVIWKELEALGVKPADVRRIYSELEPCIIPTEAAGCKRFIEKTFPNAKVTWSFEYGDAASRARGNEARKALFDKLFGGAGAKTSGAGT
ncbi:nucleic acid/nucleotide deaminase domain-containing protein [Plantactinospora sp. GCM10030261]|uniref:nucleic acid/nucleotide deaminase domain-containing protein n=1 Tax=Plantactinospora sp. GCM10030261 TaxID=3273420 RepID=UPI0036221796